MDEDEEDNGNTTDNSVTSSTVGRNQKALRFQNNTIDRTRLIRAVLRLSDKIYKPVRQFDLKNDWMAVSQYYYQRQHLRKKVSKLYNYYDINLSCFGSYVESPRKSEDVCLDSAGNYSKDTQSNWLRTCCEIVKSATAGIVESVLRHSANNIIKPISSDVSATQHPSLTTLSFSVAED